MKFAGLLRGIGQSLCLCWLIASCCFVVPVQAGYVVEYNGFASATTLDGVSQGPVLSLNTGALPQTSFSHTLDTGTVIYTNPNGVGTTTSKGTAVGTVGMGQLSGSAFGTAQTSSIQLPTSGSASVSLVWGDSITVTGPAQGDGLVHLPWTLDASDSVSLGGTGHGASDMAEALIRIQAFIGTTNILDQTIDDIVHPGDANIPTTVHVLTGTIAVAPGTVLSLQGSAAPSVQAATYNGPVDGSAIINGSTFYLNPDPLTGGSYTSDSMHNYYSAPEPASLVLLGLGGAFMFWYRWRRRER